jgi:hypothetical protein
MKNEKKVSDGRFDIDRKKENELVCKYQETEDKIILEEIYLARIPTLEFWAKKHYYPGLACSESDLMNELTITFMKAVNGYKRNRGDFNTCLFTFLDNRLKNIKSSVHAKKRTSDIYQGPQSGMILSFDYAYADSVDGDLTLQDIIPEDLYEENSAPVTLNLEDTLHVLSNGDNELHVFLRGISTGKSISSLIREYKTRQGRINHNGKLLSQKEVKAIIKDKIKEEFKLIDYKIVNGNIEYEVELKKTEKADQVIKKIRELKRNKEYYLNKLGDTI